METTTGAAKELRPLWSAGPGQALQALAATDVAIVAATNDGKLERSLDGGATFDTDRFGNPVWMPPFASAPRSGLNIVLGTSVVIPGRTAAADLIRRPPPTRARRPFASPQSASMGLYQINGFGRVGTGLWMSYATDRLFFNHTPAALFNFDNETGAAFLEEGGTNMDSPAFWSTPWVRGLPRADYWLFEYTPPVVYDGDVRQARHLSRALMFNPDLPHGDTRLLSADDGSLLALSAQGIFASDDDGQTFAKVYSPTERCCRDGAAVREANGATTVVVLSESSVLASSTSAFAFVPRAEVGTNARLVVATDRSAAWVQQRDAVTGEASTRLVAGEPTEGTLVATAGGLSRVRDGLLVTLTKTLVDRVLETSSGTFVATAGTDVLEGGEDPSTWRIVSVLPRPAVALAEHNGVALVATKEAIYALDPQQGKPRTLTRAGIRRAMQAREKDPPLDLVIAAADRRLVPHIDQRIHLAGFMPQLQVSAVAIGARSRADLNAGFLTYAINGGRAQAGNVDRAVGDAEEATFIKTRDYYDFAVSAFATWDLPQMLAHAAEPRRVREAKKAFDKVEGDIVALYRKRRDLRDRLVAMPPRDPTAREALALTVDELTARLNALSGGLFAGVRRYAREDPRGREARQVAERAAEHYFVDDDALESRKFRAAIKGTLPSTEVYVRATLSRIYEPTFNNELFENDIPWIDRAGEGFIVDSRLSLIWDLPRLVFNEEELDVYRLAHVQRLVTEEALKTHFELRRRAARPARTDALGRTLDALHREQLEKTLEALLEAPQASD